MQCGIRCTSSDQRREDIRQKFDHPIVVKHKVGSKVTIAMRVSHAQTLLGLVTLCTNTLAKKPSKLYFRRDNKLLLADQIKRVNVSHPNQCLGICLHHEKCKSFNVGGVKCDLFAEDRCSANVTMKEHEGMSYFDSVRDGRCPRGEVYFNFISFEYFFI